MDYKTFAAILNSHIFHEERLELLHTLVKHPKRFVSLFRPTKPESKLFQHILQAREIKFGDALEEIVGKLLEWHGYCPQNKRITKDLECDHYFLFPSSDRALLIEQKVRDDHDSTKRRGQWNNFEAKVQILHTRHGDQLTAVLYFVDPFFFKNRNFYQDHVIRLRNALRLQEVHLWYGQELFERLMTPDSWERLIAWLKCWRADLPILPDVNWETPEAIAELRQIAQTQPSFWLQFARCSLLWEEGIVDVLFPSRKGLQAILEVLQQMQGRSAKQAAQELQNRLAKQKPLV